MGTPPASGSLDQIRNVQRKTRFGGVEAVRPCAAGSAECSADRTGSKQLVRPGVITAMSSEAVLSSLTSGCDDGRALFFSASAQQALFGQLPCLQAWPIGGLDAGQADAGNRTALAKSAVTMKAASINRFIIAQAYSTRHAHTLFVRNLSASPARTEESPGYFCVLIPKLCLGTSSFARNSVSFVIFRSFVGEGGSHVSSEMRSSRNTGISACAPSGVALRCSQGMWARQVDAAAGSKPAGRTGHRPVFLFY